MKKRILCMLAAICLLASFFPIMSFSETASMQSEVPPQDNVQSMSVHTDSIDLPLSLQETVPASQTLRDRLLAGLFSHETEIDVSAFGVDAAVLKVTVQDLMYSEPMLFHVDSRYQFYESNGKVTRFAPQYRMNQANYATAKSYCEEQVQIILDQSGARSAKDDLTKALLLNDYIATHFSYDAVNPVHDIYGMLTTGKAVCQGYTLLYTLLLNELGIENGYAHSAAMNHIWNLVKIDGSYYHVDVTWADPVNDRYSLVYHNYFMLSDAYIRSTEPGKAHHSWTASNGITCNDTRYDGAIFSDARSPFVTNGVDLFYIDFESGDLCRYVDPFTKGEALSNHHDYWKVSGSSTSYYPGTYSGLVVIGANLYYNTSSIVGVYNLVSGADRTLVTLSDQTLQIVGLMAGADGALTYALASDITYTAPTSIERYEIPTFSVYDCNRDGLLDQADLTSLLNYLSELDVNSFVYPDVNADGVLNVEDLSAMLFALANV